jgi:hypothetical protein
MGMYCKATYKRTSWPSTFKGHNENESVHISMDAPKCPTFFNNQNLSHFWNNLLLTKTLFHIQVMLHINLLIPDLCFLNWIRSCRSGMGLSEFV